MGRASLTSWWWTPGMPTGRFLKPWWRSWVGDRGAQAGALRSPPGGAGADRGPRAYSRRATRGTSGRDLGGALGPLHRYLSWTGSGGPGPRALEATPAGGPRVEDSRQRAELDLGGGRGFGWV